ncbi:MAG: hypothetical protein P8Z42_12120 [Anaerolineales bacterium]|jgi:hypothetical protein
MFDNLRELTDGPMEYEEERKRLFDVEEQIAPERRIFGMTSGQRLVLAVLLMATVMVMGAACLLVTGKVWY